MSKASNSSTSVLAPDPVIKGRKSSKSPAKGAKGKRNKDSDIVQSCRPMIVKANQSLKHVMQGDANESERPSIPDSLLEIPSGLESSCDEGVQVPVDALKFNCADPLVLNKNNNSANVPFLRISPPHLPGSKAAEKNNKSFMQNNFRQDGESYYNASTSGGRYCLNSQNGSKYVRMLSNKNWCEKLSLLCSSREDENLITPEIPEINYLMEVHARGYQQRLLDKILDYDIIVSSPYLHVSSSREMSRTSDGSIDNSQQLDLSRLSDEALTTIEAYKIGVSLLKLGRVKEGKEEVKRAANGGLPHAKYVYAIITFKEIVQHHMDNKFRLPTQKNTKEAVECMLDIRTNFFPLPSFVLGIMQSYYQISSQDFTSLRDCLVNVLNGIKHSEGNYSLVVPKKFIVIEGENGEYLKWIVQSSKYELARNMFLHPEFKISAFETSNYSYTFKGTSAKCLLKELSSDGFLDAAYLYALALLKNAFGDEENFEKRINFNEAYHLLEQAINHGHKEAMFLFGTLPFRQGFELLDEKDQSFKGSHCFRYLKKYIEICGKDGVFKRDAAILIAAEYVKEKGSYIRYDESAAKYFLSSYNCLDELQELEKKLQERQLRATNVLPDILDVLQQVHGELKRNTKPSARQLSSKVKELLDALPGSEIIFQSSPRLSTTLELLCMPSTLEQHFLLPTLILLYQELKSQVDSKSHEEVLSPLQSLFLTCAELQMELCSEDLNTNETSTALQMECSFSTSIPSVSRQGFNPKGSSTMKDVAGISVIDT